MKTVNQVLALMWVCILDKENPIYEDTVASQEFDPKENENVYLFEVQEHVEDEEENKWALENSGFTCVAENLEEAVACFNEAVAEAYSAEEEEDQA